jgi:PAS domain S-box-containing protein
MSDTPINLLLIEDNAGDARLIREMLSEVERPLFVVECVERLSAGLDRLAAGAIDVLLVDLSLPDSQGFETFVKLHSQDLRVPILVLTGLDDQTLALRAIQEGAQDYLVKGQLSTGMLARAISYAIERKHVEQTQRFLAEASTILTASLDYTTTLERLAQLAIPDLADWCAVHMLEADGTIQRLAVAHVDPAKAVLARERTGRYPLDPNAQHIVPQVLRTGQSELYPEVPDSLLIASARDAEHLNILRLLGFKSYICVPIALHGWTFGAITLATGDSGRRYGKHDLALAEELARRAATAIDNAQLYRLAQEEIAERTRMEATLRENEERLAGIVDSAMDAIISIDESQRIQVFNTAAEQMFHCSAAEALGHTLEQFIPASFRHVHAGYIRAFGRTGVTGRSMGSLRALTALRADGQEFPIEATISQTMAAGQKLYTVIIRDITTRKRVEEQLIYQATLLHNVSDAIVASDLNFHITSWNQAAEALYGWSAEEVIGKPVQDVLETTYADDRPEQILQHFLEQGVWQGEALQKRRDGTWITVLASVTLVQDGDGRRMGTVAVNRDISDRKRSEEALRMSEARFHRTFDNMLEGCQIIGFDWRYLYVNDGVLKHGQRTREELVGHTMMEIYPGIETTDLFVALRRCMEERTPHRMQNKFDYGDGSSAWFDLSIQPGPEGIFVLSIDITERKHLEEQFYQAQKMESVGRLAGGVAHDFNNLLTAISGYAELVMRGLSPASVAYEDMEEIIKASGRAAGLTRQLLAFARKQIIEPQILQLNELIGDIERLLQRLIGEDIDIVTLLAPDLGRVRVDPGQFEQVLVNLAVNARDAMPQGGRLTIETHGVDLDHDYAQQHFGVMPGSYALIVVSDTGSGMDTETQAQIFEPFFTTKGPEHGTGLGLATCYGIIKQHGGNIWVYSEPQRGTTFKIYLPQTDAPVGAQAQLAKAADLPRGIETVLLAEDDPAVRGLAMRVLSDQGYLVLEAADGATALRLASEYIGATIDLLLTDVVMPHVSGRALFDQINMLHPNIKALFMSGYTDDAIVRQGQLDAGVAFLQKPFSSAVLVRKVRAVLDKHDA